MNKIVIHQFTPSVAYGDGVSNGVLFIQKLLAEFGFNSNIYISLNHVDIDYKKQVFHIEEYEESENNYLLYHHSIGHSYHNEIMKLKDKKILIYHNITPSHFFKNNEFLQNACDLGRQQLKDANKYIIHSLADSQYNKKELDSVGFKSTKVIPLLMDFSKKNDILFNAEIINKNSATFNIIFVGRIVQNKCQHQLIEVAYFLKQKGLNFKLFIIGGTSQVDYYNFLTSYINNLFLNNEVILTGKLNDSDLASYYKNSDLYLSLSDHEGFGIPLIEAMKYDTPVLAFNTCAIETTISPLGLLENKSARYVSNKILELLDNPIQRVEIIKEQKKILAKFDYNIIKNNFKKYLQNINIKIEEKENFIKTIPKATSIQIEGPFDSSYSLSIVNKDVACSLKNDFAVSLYSTEGHGDFKPNLENCTDNIKQLYNHKLDNIDITIRNLYPPRTNAMYGYHKIMGPYGWEESKFPQEYVQWFNTKLTMVLAVSQYVKDVLKNNGVKIPIFVTGNIVEEILYISSTPLKYKLPIGFKLLHISSGFPRKGLDILLQAFDLLKKSQEISLIIKTFPNPHNNILEELENNGYKVTTIYEKNILLYKKDTKEILLINKDIPKSQIKYLYENSNILIAPSFGEGFGLPMAESMLLNLPVITTGYGGQIDFCTNETSWLIDFEFVLSNSHLNLKDSLWAAPKVESLKMLIESIYNAPSTELQKRTAIAKEFILKNYSSKEVSNKIISAIENYNYSVIKKEKKLGWISSYNTKCGIATYSDFIIENLENLDIKIFSNYTKSIISQKKEENVIRCWNDRFDESNQILINQIINANCSHVIINFNFAFFSMKNLEEIIEHLYKNNIKITIVFHSVADVNVKGLESSLSWIKKSLKKVDNILVHSIEDINFFKNLDLLNVNFLPHGVKNRVNINSQIKENITTISSYGFILPHKGILDLINAFSILEKEFSYLKLVLVNAVYPAKVSEDYLYICKQRVEELGLSNKVTFYSDFLSDEKSYELLDETDLLVMPYHKTNESASGAIRYAISTLNPVLCTKEPIFNDVKDIVHFIDGTSENDIAKSIKKLILNKELLYSKNEKQKLWIEAHDWKNIALILLNYL